MSILLLTGIVLTAVPLLLMIGFAGFIFFMFMQDDPDSSALVKVAFIVMFIGLLLIAGHFIVQSIN